MPDVPLYRLYVLRAYYALVAVGSAIVFWPPLLAHDDRFGVADGAQYALLAALSPLFLIGVARPLAMLPVLIYEFLWKLLWFVLVALPLWRHGAMTEGTWANVYACSIAVVLTPLVAPWPYLWHRYVIAPADRWR